MGSSTIPYLGQVEAWAAAALTATKVTSAFFRTKRAWEERDRKTGKCRFVSYTPSTCSLAAGERQEAVAIRKSGNSLLPSSHFRGWPVSAFSSCFCHNTGKTNLEFLTDLPKSWSITQGGGYSTSLPICPGLFDAADCPLISSPIVLPLFKHSLWANLALSEAFFSCVIHAFSIFTVAGSKWSAVSVPDSLSAFWWETCVEYLKYVLLRGSYPVGN